MVRVIYSESPLSEYHEKEIERMIGDEFYEKSSLILNNDNKARQLYRLLYRYGRLPRRKCVAIEGGQAVGVALLGPQRRRTIWEGLIFYLRLI
ncbi:hypothetical protein P9112_013037 [Eukaryota sp. TZLM1-RC]